MIKDLVINCRENQEKIENEYLVSWASLSKNSEGRKKKESLDRFRTIYQRDKDRILYTKSFRRLKHKTQVFLSPYGDHYRTRLTHTLEVSQIARSIARALRLNEDLTEAIALAHDLGHTPFGHCGERALNDVHKSGFNHAEQSLRVVDIIEERKNKDFRGLNLSFEVRDGILNHSGENKAITPEGRIIKYADRIAYLNHDLEDAIRAGILKEADLPSNIINILGDRTSIRINSLITNIVENSIKAKDIVMSDRYLNILNEFRNFMFKNLYLESKAKSEEVKAEFLIKTLYNYFSNNFERIPRSFNYDIKSELVKDYIAGMSDRYAINIYNKLFVPNFWH